MTVRNMIEGWRHCLLQLRCSCVDGRDKIRLQYSWRHVSCMLAESDPVNLMLELIISVVILIHVQGPEHRM